MPVIAAISGTVSLAAVPANLLALPAVPFTTVLGLLAAVVSLVSPGMAGVLCTVAGAGCHWLVLVARTAAHLPLGDRHGTFGAGRVGERGAGDGSARGGGAHEFRATHVAVHRRDPGGGAAGRAPLASARVTRSGP